MVDPDLVSILDANIVTRGKDFGDLDVTDDNVVLVKDTEANTDES